jgi:septum formation protein
MRLVLASASPRRRELLALFGLPFERIEPQVDEARQAGEAPLAYVRRLALGKAEAAIGMWKGGPALILAADTIVVLGDQTHGKPRDSAEATEMLRLLAGRTHRVITALALIETPNGRTVTDECASDVPMRAYREDEIAAYVASGDPLDKAGAYAIQDRTFDPAPDFAHCFANVMGLPLCSLARSLHALDSVPPVSRDAPDGIATACQAHLDYRCPVWRDILGPRPSNGDLPLDL